MLGGPQARVGPHRCSWFDQCSPPFSSPALGEGMGGGRELEVGEEARDHDRPS
jgi:hypothetical protein